MAAKKATKKLKKAKKLEPSKPLYITTGQHFKTGNLNM
jgi:hypothetical protein